MARSKLQGVIKRQLTLYGISAPVVLTITRNGVELAVAGFKTRISGSWETIAKALDTPDNAPSTLYDKPFEFLKWQEAKYQRAQEGKVNRNSS